jgi:hypothetical protein
VELFADFGIFILHERRRPFLRIKFYKIEQITPKTLIAKVKEKKWQKKFLLV